MAEAGPLVFEGVTTAQYARLVDRAKAAGIEIVGDSGKVHKFGAAIEYDYAPGQESLETGVHEDAVLSQDQRCVRAASLAGK